MLGVIKMTALRFRRACPAAAIGFATVLAATPASAATTEISGADTAWMIVATGLVLMMTMAGVFAAASIGGTAGLLEGHPGAAPAAALWRRCHLVWSAGMTYGLLKLVNVFVPLRVSREHGLEGLDISQHGEALQ